MSATDLDRVLALPRRGEPHPDLPRLMTQHCARPGVTPPFQLYPEQAQVLVEAVDCTGVVMAAIVGTGKTICTFLIPTVLGAQRPLLVVPAHLRSKTLREWDEYSEHWRLVPLTVKSYTEISRDKDSRGVSQMLDLLQPDAIICDEAHHIGNLAAGCTRKIRRYRHAHPECSFHVFSGTFFDTSLMDAWHLCGDALRDGSPLPLRKGTCLAWSQATDPQYDDETRDRKASRAGLGRLCAAVGESDPRRAIQSWMADTPGYVTSRAKYDGPLTIDRVSVAVPPECEDHLAAVARGVRPDGEPIDPFERLGVADQYPGGATAERRSLFARWRLAQTLFLGYWDRPDPEPPSSWLLARAEWALFVAAALEVRGDLDTPEAVAYAVERGRIDGGKRELAAWRRERDGYRYRTRAEWVARDAPALQHAAEWIATHPHGLVWSPSESAGRQVCRLAGLDPAEYLYGAGQGKPRAGGTAPQIEAHDKGAAVLTIDANKSGRNLQFKWRDNLFLATSSLSGTHDQTIGRTHRPGQRHPVTVTYVRGLPAHDRAWASALDNAAFIAGVTGDTPKILLANLGEGCETE